jgi:hypothetical protein
MARRRLVAKKLSAAAQQIEEALHQRHQHIEVISLSCAVFAVIKRSIQFGACR